MITCSLVVILYHHDRSLLAVTHCQTRISSNSHTVNTELPKCSKKYTNNFIPNIIISH